LSPNRTKRFLSGDGRAVFEVLLHGGPLERRFRVQGSEVVNYDGWLLFRLLGSGVQSSGFKVQGLRFKV